MRPLETTDSGNLVFKSLLVSSGYLYLRLLLRDTCQRLQLRWLFFWMAGLSCLVVLAPGLLLMAVLPQLPKCWVYRHELLFFALCAGV